MSAIGQYFPVWDKLDGSQQETVLESAVYRTFSKGTILHNGSADCIGLFVVRAGQLRAYILSDEGKEVTLYRLFERDVCLFSASCMISSIQFDIVLEAERDTDCWIVPVSVYQQLMERSVAVSNYTNQLMASRFSEVMWLMDQVLFKSFDTRLAAFLLEESNIEQSDELTITHEKVAQHIGTAREVVTRMLKYFQSEGMTRLSRGVISITDKKKLRALIK